MVQCCIESCKLSSDNGMHLKMIRDLKITFHKVPKQADRRAQWHFMMRDHCQNVAQRKSPYVCSRHFLEDDFHYPGRGKHRRFLPEAFPRIFEKPDVQPFLSAILDHDYYQPDIDVSSNTSSPEQNVQILMPEVSNHEISVPDNNVFSNDTQSELLSTVNRLQLELEDLKKNFKIQAAENIQLKTKVQMDSIEIQKLKRKNNCLLKCKARSKKKLAKWKAVFAKLKKKNYTSDGTFQIVQKNPLSVHSKHTKKKNS